MPQARRVGTAGDEAGDLTARRNQLVLADEGLDALAQLLHPRIVPQSSENERPVGQLAGHPDRVVEAQRGRVLRPHEEADGRDVVEQQAAQVAESPARVTASPRLGIDPDLLELHRRRRPRRRLCLEEDHPLVEPEPGAPLLDLLAGAPPEALGIAPERIDSYLFSMRLGTRGHEQVEVEQTRRAQPRLARLRWLAERVDRLTGTVVTWPGKPPLPRLPQLPHRPLLADHHPSTAPRGRLRERRAPLARGDDVGAHVAQRFESPVSLGDRGEAAEPAPSDVLEEDALDRLPRAEVEHLVECRGHRLGHDLIIPSTGRYSARGLPPGAGGFAGGASSTVRVASVPIHLRAEPGDYADAVLLPGDPLRAKYIADTYLENVKQVNAERG